jgi:hypothetical protein
MIRIAITEAAFKAITATLSLGSVAYEAEVTAKGERLIWIEPPVADRLFARSNRARLPSAPAAIRSGHPSQRAA